MKVVVTALLGICLLASVACTNMNRTQQGVTSGALLGAGGGAAIGALAGGSGTLGALIGGGAGAIAGGLVGYQDGGDSLF